MLLGYFKICCAGLVVPIMINAQNLPTHPTQQQVIGYQLQQQKQWQLHQLPKNSVLYQYNLRAGVSSPLSLSLKKEKQVVFNLPASSLLNSPYPGELSLPVMSRLSTLQLQLQQQRHLYNQWRKQSWWKDPASGQGSLWLRDFLINSRNANFLF